MKSGLYTVPGDSATACAAAAARRLAAPTTKLSNRYRPSSATRLPGDALRRAQLAEHELGDAPQCLEHPRPVQRVGGVLGHAAEVERVRQLRHRQDQIARQVLLVVLDDERHSARVDPLLGQIRVQVLKGLDVLLKLAGLT